MQAGFARAAINAAKAGKPIVSVSSDLQGSTGMAPFHKEFPELSFDIGIAESNMVSAAAGLSKLGYIPVVDTFAAFGVTKGNLPLIMAALSQCPMIAVFSHTGFQDAADGASHQSLTYLAAVSSIPYTNVIVVGSSEEAEVLMTEAINEIELARIERRAATSYIFFVGRENFPATLNQKVKLGEPQIIKEGKDGVLLACGPMIHKALEAAQEMKHNGLDITVVNNHAVNFANFEKIREITDANQGKILTIEDHQVIGGMGAQIIQGLTNLGATFKARTLGVKGHFGQSAYTANELYNKNGLGVLDIVSNFNQL
jgi:transketolase